ncbi:MAG: Uma2 family endonuclease [SAR324 cluster bacterium]|nr:Uma2 family endonuclease [SAR324 cluster bacterium]
MNWQEICEDPSLQDLPFKIELNQWGKIEMSPAKNRHAFLQAKVIKYLLQHAKNGAVLPECPILTTDNVKVADVVWVSDERAEILKNESISSIAPEICVEIQSSGNTNQEMMLKKKLYLDAGAEEFWLCDEYGNIKIYNKQGLLEQSRLYPDFPMYIEI